MDLSVTYVRSLFFVAPKAVLSRSRSACLYLTIANLLITKGSPGPVCAPALLIPPHPPLHNTLCPSFQPPAVASNTTSSVLNHYSEVINISFYRKNCMSMLSENCSYTIWLSKHAEKTNKTSVDRAWQILRTLQNYYKAWDLLLAMAILHLLGFKATKLITFCFSCP